MSKRCAYCGREIDEYEGYYSFMDNFLQTKYFESEEENIFCSGSCACKALMLEPEILEKTSSVAESKPSDVLIETYNPYARRTACKIYAQMNSNGNQEY